MVNKPKAQGTAWESNIVERLKMEGFYAKRIAEGGAKDEGDVGFHDVTGEHWIIEAKATANLNVSQTLAKAKAKAPLGTLSAVVWKKLTRKGDNQRRTPDGEPVVVVMDWDTYMLLVSG